ncbi:hypothetical protein EDB84DRAFT_374019 [Lactarius hengduanensis]|nr:hypothetical protein EDB84DRAFT_374019 [Lactarius hengduanensis]
MFFPPLDSTLVVDVPSNARAGGVSLLFRARTGSASALEQLKQDGVKVQAWTNAPVDGDHTEGEWGAYNFEEAPAAAPVNVGNKSVEPFPLPPPTEDNIVDEPYTLFLTLKLKALPRYQTEADFLVTYRLQYPSGEVKWLGYHGRDLRCVLKKTDPWLALPASANPGSPSRLFSSVSMKEPWGCWAIGPRSVKYYPKGVTTDGDATFLVFVPKRGPSTVALHQPIILHGANLKLDSSGAVTCSTSIPTRVYTAIASEPELSSAIPDLGLHWLGAKEGYAFITSAAPEQPVSIHAVPLSINTVAVERPITVDLDLASHGLLAEHPRFVVYNPLTDAVLESDNWGSHQLHLSLGSSGGSCVVSPVYALPTSKFLPVGKATWGIAYLTPHTLATEPEEEEGDEEEEDAEPDAEPEAEPAAPEPEAGPTDLEYDSEIEFLNREIKPPPPRRRLVSAVYNPRRTVEFLIPLLWRTMGYLVRALIIRLFTMIGLPAVPLLAHRRLMQSHVVSIGAETRASTSGSISTHAEPANMVAASESTEKSEGSGEAVGSDSATEVASTVGGERWPPTQVFNVPKGPLSLLVHTDESTNDGDEKVRSLLPVVVLDGERVNLKAASLGHGWAIVRANGGVKGGRVEVYGTQASTWNGRAS